MRQPRIPRKLWLGVGLLLVVAFFSAGLAAAQEDESPVVVTTGSPIHPTFPLLDATGENVLDTGAPVSTMTTCGACHDAEFIAEHSFHADAGLSQFTTVGDVPGGQSWDSSNGPFGRWNPVLYRYLSPEGDERVDLTTAEWVQWFVRHPGGGPAVYSRDGELLTDLAVDAANVETAIVNASGEMESWDWNESGTVAMNCFLCHYPDPNNDARIAALAAGDFDGANTATLVGTGLVEAAAEGWAWNAEAFSEDGNLKREYILVQDPTTANCGECHGVTHTDLNTPLTLEAYTLGDYNTMTTGQVMSPQRISDSGLNLADKAALNRSWDIHIERVFDCSNCHYSLNNPIYFQEAAAEQPDHLAFDPRRMDLGDYIYRPLHEFAKGQSAQSVQAPGLDNTLRRCESCHTLEENHEWLPYKDRHTEVLACESCHIPELYAPALQYVDWTVLGSDGEPVRAYRGLEGNELTANAFITGYEPVLLPRENSDGDATLAPFNLVTTWYWVYGTVDRPVPLRDLQAAWLTEDGSYHPDILAALDADGDGALSQAELVLEDETAVGLISGRLADLGLANPRIAGEVLPYSINHNVARGEFATRECRTCHADESQINQPFDLADRQPGNVTPTLAESTGISWSGGVAATDEGTLQFQSTSEEAGIYILGHDANSVIDLIGSLAFVGVLLGVFLHGGLRWWYARQQATSHEVALREVYMYDVYERLWHWLQTGAILLLLFTGLVIHKPSTFGIFSFRYMVQVHNILAAILVINAALSLFYHLASGEIKQYLPKPRGFFDQAITQSLFYVRGIFRNEPHPFDKDRDRKLNPLQQMTYFAILNLLLPLQIITGAFMWGVQQWPDMAARLGGLPFLAPFHTLIAWLFASFIVMHVYLTTTGHKPLAGIRAMMMGWDEVEVHGGQPAPADGTD